MMLYIHKLSASDQVAKLIHSSQVKRQWHSIGRRRRAFEAFGRYIAIGTSKRNELDYGNDSIPIPIRCRRHRRRCKKRLTSSSIL